MRRHISLLALLAVVGVMAACGPSAVADGPVKQLTAEPA